MRIILLIALLLPASCFSQDETPVRDELIYNSILNSSFQKRHFTKNKPVYVLIDSVNLSLKSFIQDKFPRYNWRIFTLEESQQIFEKTPDGIGIFQLETWNRGDKQFCTFDFTVLIRSYNDDKKVFEGPFSARRICGTGLYTCSLEYDSTGKSWKFVSNQQLEERVRRLSTTEQDRNRCLPTDDSEKFF